MSIRPRHLLATLAFAASGLAHADLTGIYLSQLSPSDPGYAQGSGDPIYLVVVDRNGSVIGTVNSSYKPGNGINVNVWTAAVLSNSGPSTTSLIDSFGLCNVSVRVSADSYSQAPGQITVQTVSSANKPGVANPLGIDCTDLYPTISRDFKRFL